MAENSPVDCRCPVQVAPVAITGQLCEFTPAPWPCFILAIFIFLGSQVLAKIKNNANYDPALFFC
jgi:hypothetical protein